MQLVIISGRSGSGISSALRGLEDGGLTCIDNLPVVLLAHLATSAKPDQRFAVTIDTRSNLEQLPNFGELYQYLSQHCDQLDVIFLDARDDILLRRFNETRRKHPLSSADLDLQSAISQESELLAPLSQRADHTIDTSNLSLHELRARIQSLVIKDTRPKVALQFQSFGFKRGLPAEADVIFDVRCLPNPFWQNDLKEASGNDDSVVEFLSQQPLVQEMLTDIGNYLTKWLPHYIASNRSYITVAIGCTGGQHRSVFVCNHLAELFHSDTLDVLVRHRDLAVPS